MEVLVDDVLKYIFKLTLLLRWKDVPIKRKQPKEREYIEYPRRLNNFDFARYDYISKYDLTFHINYIRWKNDGFDCSSGEIFPIGSQHHKDAGNRFYINGTLFTEFENIDQDKYNLETQAIHSRISKENRLVDLHNADIRRTKSKYSSLSDWNSYVVVGGEKYGIFDFSIPSKPSPLRFQHNRDNCGGIAGPVMNNPIFSIECDCDRNNALTTICHHKYKWKCDRCTYFDTL